MAYTAGNLVLISQGNGFCHYRYDTMDTVATVDGSGYFDNEDNSLNLRVGDVIDVIVWGTAVRTGTISAFGRVIVNSVSGGVTDTTNDVNLAAVADSD